MPILMISYIKVVIREILEIDGFEKHSVNTQTILCGVIAKPQTKAIQRYHSVS
jgi:hypothetical protein